MTSCLRVIHSLGFQSYNLRLWRDVAELSNRKLSSESHLPLEFGSGCGCSWLW